jgi:hypothetical protein
LAVLKLLLGASFRRRWRSWLLLGLLIALVNGLVLAAATAGRRTSSAFPQYEAVHGYDGFLYGTSPIPKIATLPDVTSAQLVRLPEGGTPTCSCSRPINSNDFSLFEAAPQNLSHMVKLVSGSMPDQSDPNQVLASFTLQRDDGVHIGTVIRVPLFAASQRNAVSKPQSWIFRPPVLPLTICSPPRPSPSHSMRNRLSFPPTSSGFATERPIFPDFNPRQKRSGACQ